MEGRRKGLDNGDNKFSGGLENGVHPVRRQSWRSREAFVQRPETNVRKTDGRSDVFHKPNCSDCKRGVLKAALDHSWIKDVSFFILFVRWAVFPPGSRNMPGKSSSIFDFGFFSSTAILGTMEALRGLLT